ncbi:hypothetical protein ACFYYD_05975 [Streptomyces bluensis]|uniref:hypothetical protein n=1 Tax=Streptomyces bluensis TaxID=33897 RepID=UPI0036C01D8B
MAHTEEFADRIRVWAALPARLSEARRRSLLVTLADADRYGHDVTADGAVIWGEIDRCVTPDSNNSSADGS